MPFNCFSPNSAGQPVKIIEIGEDNKLLLNENGLKSVLFHQKCKGKQVCLISVAGAFRKGKSFLLNFFIRFFKNGGRDNWLGNENDVLNGFHWRGGCDRDTTGVFLWSEPYLLRTLQNEEVVVLLMDTQGAFDTTSTVKHCATLFALSLMVSSIQIYNLSQNIQEDDLQHLHLFADYGRLALNETNHAPFQMLLFLIRDWSYSYEFPYGYVGGQHFLLKRINANNTKTQELIETRSFIKKCFKQIRCFLLPHPGLTASSNANFGGKLSEVDTQFKQQAVNLIEGLFQEKLFQIKEINGQRITCSELFEYFKIYFQVFQSNELPSPKTLLRATAEANNLAAKALSKEFYQKLMDQHCGADAAFVKPEDLRSIHIDSKNKALNKFESSKKLGGSEISIDYLKELNEELDSMFIGYSKTNRNKQSLTTSKTPTILLLLMITNYLISNILTALWLGCFSFIFTFIFYVSFFSLIIWCYVRCNGQYKEILLYVDIISNFVWDRIIQPISGKFISNIFHLALSNFSVFTKSNCLNNNTLSTILNESINSMRYVNSRGDARIVSNIN